MPFQNRVDPYGRLHAVPARGTLMGNRGVLHDETGRVVAPWRTRRWIACALEFRGRRREVFAPRRYSELFFLDEATALSAGHRPCAECRRSRYEEFRSAWAAGQGRLDLPSADDIDRVLHEERRGASFSADLARLPSGVLVELEKRPHLLASGALRPWSFGGYGRPRDSPLPTRVRVLTPRSIVRAIRAGYAPGIHGSASEVATRTRGRAWS